MKAAKFTCVIIVIIALLYFANMFNSQQDSINKKKQELEDAKEKIELVEKEIEELKEEKEHITSDEYMEKAAREKYGMVKKGEKVFVDAENVAD